MAGSISLQILQGRCSSSCLRIQEMISQMYLH